jgi:endogenous inhibitor of DNA gyrase (YacG/DUF329 family)
MMGTMEEKLIAGSRATGGKLMSQLLDRVIVSPKIDSRDLLAEDRLFLLIKLRILTFGSTYHFKMGCPQCGKVNTYEVDLGNLNVNEIPEGFVEPLTVKLPISGETVNLRLLRGYDDEEVTKAAKRFQEKGSGGVQGDPSYIPTLARSIHSTSSIDENDYDAKLKFVQELKSLDSRTMTCALENIKIGVDMNQTLTCPTCQADFEASVPFSEEFFRPKL